MQVLQKSGRTWSGTWTKEERSLDFLLIVDDDRDCRLKDLLGIPVPRLPSKRFSSLLSSRKRREREGYFFRSRHLEAKRVIFEMRCRHFALCILESRKSWFITRAPKSFSLVVRQMLLGLKRLSSTADNEAVVY